MDESRMSLEGRVQALETICNHLNQQLKVMKKFVETRITEMQGALDSEVEEIKQIIIQQDRVYQERIRRLDTRVEQLSEFVLHMAKQKGADTGMGLSVLEGLGQPPPRHTSPGLGHRLGAVGSNRGGGVGARGVGEDFSGDEDEEERPHTGGRRGHGPVGNGQPTVEFPNEEDVQITQGDVNYRTVLDQNRDRIDAIFDIYVTLGFYGKNRRTMDLGGFTKLVKDCNLCNINPNGLSNAINSNLPPPELLWMMVLKKLDPSSHLAHESRSKRELTPQQFDTALIVLAEEHFKHRDDLSMGQRLELLLKANLFPGAQPRIDAARGGEGEGPSGVTASRQQLEPSYVRDVLVQYDIPAVNDTIKRNQREIQVKFNHFAARYQKEPGGARRKALIFQGFMDLAKDHNLLPFIPKVSLRTVFNAICASRADDPSRKNQRDAKEPEMTFEKFLLALKLLAEVIYGDKLYAQTYPSPTLRFDKLFAKLFLLKNGTLASQGWG